MYGGCPRSLTLPNIATTGTPPQRPKTKVLFCPSTTGVDKRHILFHDRWIFDVIAPVLIKNPGSSPYGTQTLLVKDAARVLRPDPQIMPILGCLRFCGTRAARASRQASKGSWVSVMAVVA